MVDSLAYCISAIFLNILLTFDTSKQLGGCVVDINEERGNGDKACDNQY